MTSVRWVLGLLAVSLLVGACATTGSSSSPESKSGVSADRIVVDELDFPVDGQSAYDLVSQYKAQWLEKRGRMSINNPVSIKVYVDNTGSPLGGISSLREIRAQDVAYIEHYDGTAAQFKFGVSNNAGAILVRTKPADS